MGRLTTRTRSTWTEIDSISELFVPSSISSSQTECHRMPSISLSNNVLWWSYLRDVAIVRPKGRFHRYQLKLAIQAASELELCVFHRFYRQNGQFVDQQSSCARLLSRVAEVPILRVGLIRRMHGKEGKCLRAWKGKACRHVPLVLRCVYESFAKSVFMGTVKLTDVRIDWKLARKSQSGAGFIVRKVMVRVRSIPGSAPVRGRLMHWRGCRYKFALKCRSLILLSPLRIRLP
jgi:hypothetical protein